jgi:hypothetical protein
VVEATLGYFDDVIVHPINEPMFLIDAARPKARIFPQQGFWLANAFKGRPHRGPD